MNWIEIQYKTVKTLINLDNVVSITPHQYEEFAPYHVKIYTVDRQWHPVSSETYNEFIERIKLYENSMVIQETINTISDLSDETKETSMNCICNYNHEEFIPDDNCVVHGLI